MGNLGQAISEILFRLVSIETDSFSLSLRVGPDGGKFEFAITSQGALSSSFRIPLRLDDLQQISKSHRLFTRIRNRSLFFPSFRRIEGGFDYLSNQTPADDVKWIFAADKHLWRSADEGLGILQKAMSQLSSELSVYGQHQLIAAISTHDIGELLTKKYGDVLRKTDEPYAELLNEVAQLSKEISQKISETKSLVDTVPILADIQKRIAQVNKERESSLELFSVLADRMRDVFQYKGIRVTKDITLGEKDGAIDSDKLSAGEKQLLSFWCYNTFNENTAIFIDEPELSLHVDWQRRLLPTLLEQETGNQFFIATHSPFIYAKYPDKEILLGEDRGGS